MIQILDGILLLGDQPVCSQLSRKNRLVTGTTIKSQTPGFKYFDDNSSSIFTENENISCNHSQDTQQKYKRLRLELAVVIDVNKQDIATLHLTWCWFLWLLIFRKVLASYVGPEPRERKTERITTCYWNKRIRSIDSLTWSQLQIWTKCLNLRIVRTPVHQGIH